MKIRLEYFSNTEALMALRAPEMQVLILEPVKKVFSITCPA